MSQAFVSVRRETARGRRLRSFLWLGLGLVFPGLGLCAAPQSGGQAAASVLLSEARNIVGVSGISGGLILEIGPADSGLALALSRCGPFLVQVCAPPSPRLAAARKRILAAGLADRVGVVEFRGGRLPYTDNLADIVVIPSPVSALSKNEVLRVLRPGGVVVEPRGKAWGRSFAKPRPKGLDDWGHALHDATNNAVSSDDAVGPPRHFQWVAPPAWCRSHEHLSSISVAVSAGARIFDIEDDGPAAAVALPSRWRLAARNAFNGILLWRRPIGPWENRLRGFRSGPADLQRMLVATDDVVYVIPGYGKPALALSAATGRVLRSYAGTSGARELLVNAGILFVVVGVQSPAGKLTAEQARRRGIMSPPLHHKWIMAFRAGDGRRLWRRQDRETAEVLPATLAAAGDRVFFQNPAGVVCLAAGAGKTLWRAPRPSPTVRPGWSTPTLVAYGGVVFSAGRVLGRGKPAPAPDTPVTWRPSSAGGRAPKADLVAFSAETGQRLWSCPCREGYNSPVDVLIAGGLLWTGNQVTARNPGIIEGRDPYTGKVLRTRKPDQASFRIGMSHHRCYRDKATNRYLLLGRAGVEFVDVKTGAVDPNHWVRGACQYGILVANGLLYAPSHACACYITTKLHGFLALAPEAPDLATPQTYRPGGRLEPGPAYSADPGPAADPEDWPTYRHDPARSGVASTRIGEKLEPLWRTRIGGRLTPPIAAAGRIYLARKESGELIALDRNTGHMLWRRLLGGPVDSPPTFYRGRLLIGCHDGWLYCFRAADGALAWRFLVAPVDRRIVAYDHVESAWPVPGSVLVEKGVAYAVAGRSSVIDGGLFLVRLDPISGKFIGCTRVCSVDPKTGAEIKKAVHGLGMNGSLPDILSSDGASIFMRHSRFDLSGKRAPDTVPHLFSSVGFADAHWWHRTYWLYGTGMGQGWGGWLIAGNRLPSGRLLVAAPETIFGFGREIYAHCGSHVGLDESTAFSYSFHGESRDPRTRWVHYDLFATSKSAALDVLKRRNRRFSRRRGMGSYIGLANSRSLNPARTPFTVSAWICPERPDGVVLARGGSTHGYALYLRHGKPEFAIRVNQRLIAVTGPNSIPMKTWTHLAGVLSAAQRLALYVDGKAVAGAAAPGFIARDPAEAMEIGGDAPASVGLYSAPALFRGAIDEVRVYRRALSPAEVNALARTGGGAARAPGKKGLVLYLSFDDGDAADLSGHGNNGVAVGVLPAPGKVGRAMRFTGRRRSGRNPALDEKPKTWSEPTDMVAHGMLLAAFHGRGHARAVLCVAGAGRIHASPGESPPKGAVVDPALLQPFEDMFQGRNGKLWLISPKDGRVLVEFPLGAPPVFDGLIAARGRLYLSAENGTVVALGMPAASSTRNHDPPVRRDR